MATADLIDKPADSAGWSATSNNSQSTSTSLSDVLQVVASLRLTVVLFGLSIFLVFVGTLAQVDHDVWHVVNHTYFRVWIAQVEFRAFGRLAAMFTDGLNPTAWTGSFPFPGGRIIGIALAANLLAAHAIRFKTAAKGSRLTMGLGVLLAGAAATAAVVASGMDNAIESELSPEFCNGLWQALRASLVGCGLLACLWVVRKWKKIGMVEWATAATLAGLVVGSAVYLLLNPEWRIDDSGLRILWQLLKCTAAAVVLLVGCVMVFKKRAGIVLLHAGVGLLLASELVTDLTAHESRMSIPEGQAATFSYDIRTTELAIVDRSGEKTDRVATIPQSLLAQAARSGSTISSPELPFDVKVVEFLGNSDLKKLAPGQTNLATEGFGLDTAAVPIRSVNGVTNQGINWPSAYVELLDKQTGDSAGVLLVSAMFNSRPEINEQQQTLASTSGDFDVSLRFERDYKPYTLTLNEFRYDRYVGTETAKNYSSDVRLVDADRNIDREFHISMNNPLRYAGETFYQADFDKSTEQTTVLQVVKNRGWMLPYISLMVVGIGMLFQFLVTLGRFVNRRAEAEARAAKQQVEAGERPAGAGGGLFAPQVWFPVLMALVVGGCLFGMARRPADSPVAMQVHAFGALPIAEGGRIKPFDTLARTTLQFLSGRQEVKLDNGEKLPAITWMLDAIAGKPVSRTYRVFRIENLDLIDTLGLEPRPGSFRYSYTELFSKKDELSKQFELVRSIPDEQQTVFQKKVGELAERFISYNVMAGAFGKPNLSSDMASMQAEMAIIQDKIQQLRRSSSARSIPPVKVGDEWLTLFEAELRDLFDQTAGRDRNPATVALSAALSAYANDDPRGFKKQIVIMQDLMAERQAEQNDPANAEKLAGLALAERLNLGVVKFETLFSASYAFYNCAVCYVIAFVLAVLSWLGWTKPLSRAATAVILVTFLMHTFALVGRIYISGRPPVTNLYSSAVFIGWGAVLFGLLVEALYRIGVGNLISAIIGFLTLVVAHQLSLDGDTFTVMQAVLDTQFWLATHVVCITFGYLTTFVAGAMGCIYLIGGHALGALDKQARDTIARVTYGMICFAMLFSFVGTVLGGLWADDSWGRFWGWDPKENGALIIVLWNALILHARWGRMVGARGLVTLAVLGNIVTTWSWFGVNELGVGLHAYGASERGTALWLLSFAASQLVIALLALIPEQSDRGPTLRNEPAT